jgi:glycosyltransferase 2 family protein
MWLSAFVFFIQYPGVNTILRKLQTLLKALAFFAFGFAILYFFYLKQDKAWKEQCALEGIASDQCRLIDKLVVDFANADFRWIALVALMAMISHVSRAIRWQMLVRPLGFRPRFVNAFFSIGVAYFANLGFPRIGELVRAVTFSRYEHVPPEKAMGTVIVDRVADGLTLLVVLALVLVFESKTILHLIGALRSGDEGEAGGFPWLLAIALAGLAGLVVMWMVRKSLGRIALFRKIFDMLRGFGEGIKTIAKLETPWAFLFHSLNIWLMYYLMAYVAFFAFAPTAHLGPLAGLIVFAASALGFLVPSPGGMGAYHFMVASALTLFYGVGNADAFSFANIVFFAIQIGVTVIFGITSLILLPVVNRPK